MGFRCFRRWVESLYAYCHLPHVKMLKSISPMTPPSAAACSLKTAFFISRAAGNTLSYFCMLTFPLSTRLCSLRDFHADKAFKVYWPMLAAILLDECHRFDLIFAST